MPEDVLNPAYWSNRASTETGHRKVFKCPEDRWQQIKEAHKRILAENVSDSDAVLDVGCGWGRLIDLMPATWCNIYLGIDLCPEFIEQAKASYPNQRFMCGDVIEILPRVFPRRLPKFDIAILVSIAPMLRRNVGDEYWYNFRDTVLAHSKKILYLEYDPDDPGNVQFP